NDPAEERRAMVAPVIPFAVSQVPGAFPGTISLKPATVLAVVTETIGSLAQQGFRRFLIVNGHHAGKAVLDLACAQAHADLSGVRCLAVQWWELPEVRSVVLEMSARARDTTPLPVSSRSCADSIRGRSSTFP